MRAGNGHEARPAEGPGAASDAAAGAEGGARARGPLPPLPDLDQLIRLSKDWLTRQRLGVAGLGGDPTCVTLEEHEARAAEGARLRALNDEALDMELATELVLSGRAGRYPGRAEGSWMQRYLAVRALGWRAAAMVDEREGRHTARGGCDDPECVACGRIRVAGEEERARCLAEQERRAWREGRPAPPGRPDQFWTR